MRCFFSFLVFMLCLSAQAQEPITSCTYWLGDDFAHRTTVDVTLNAEGEVELSIDFPDDGEHYIDQMVHLQFKNAAGEYSPILSRPVRGKKDDERLPISIEYWYKGKEDQKVTQPMETVYDGNSVVEQKEIAVPWDYTTDRRIYYRFKSKYNYITPIFSKSFKEFAHIKNKIVALEYWYNDAVNELQRIEITPENDNVDISIPWNVNYKKVSYRFLNDAGIYSYVISKNLEQYSNIDNKITLLEYWYDDDITSKQSIVLDTQTGEIIESLPWQPGKRKISYRFQSKAGAWSPVITKNLEETNKPIEENRIVKAEYWFNDFFNHKIVKDISAEESEYLDDHTFDLSNRNYLIHTINVRYQDKLGNWSPVYSMETQYDGDIIHTPAVPESEYEALKELYTATNGANWVNTWDIFKNELHYFPWYGVKVENGHVTKIELANNNLVGYIPDILNRLPELQIFDVQHNHVNRLEGEVPEDLNVKFQQQENDFGEVELSSSNIQFTNIHHYNVDYKNYTPQQYKLKIGSSYSQSKEVPVSGIKLKEVMPVWNFQQNERIQFIQTSGAAKDSKLNFVLTYINGDVNIDGDVNVLDLQTQINYILGEQDIEYFNKATANQNNDSSINVLDIVKLVTVIQATEHTNGNAGNTSRRRVGEDSKVNIHLAKDGIYIEPLKEAVASFELRLSGIKAEQIQELLSKEGYQVVIKDLGKKVSVLAYTFDKGISSKTKIADYSTDIPLVETAVLSNAKAKEMSWKVIADKIEKPKIIEQEQSTGTIKVYPNPFSHTATVLFNTAGEGVGNWKLFDSSGKLIFNNRLNIQKGENKLKINRNQLPAGKYIIVIECNVDNNVKLLKANILVQ
ncbi:T9SS type A sorting domain-containing protein [Weeksellaceae bacterium TAE3-ERU29]|nr:T9SS type A sorting domain-containing protein [Weeksellaceae bacterium TAE3-ERU29]